MLVSEQLAEKANKYDARGLWLISTPIRVVAEILDMAGL
jgi:hypothetical protein